jgi:galactokinase
MAKRFGCEYLGDLVYKYSQEEIFEILNTIQDTQLKGLALYGLAESARLKNLKKDFSLKKLGAHLNLSHQSEIIYHIKEGKWQELSQEEKLFYEFNSSKPLSNHCGIYRASTKQNDILQYLATQVPGVLGSSLSGAGLGGNNVILAGFESKANLINTLDKNFYQHYGQTASDQLHFSTSSDPAGILIK